MPSNAIQYGPPGRQLRKRRKSNLVRPRVFSEHKARAVLARFHLNMSLLFEEQIGVSPKLRNSRLVNRLRV